MTDKIRDRIIDYYQFRCGTTTDLWAIYYLDAKWESLGFNIQRELNQYQEDYSNEQTY